MRDEQPLRQQPRSLLAGRDEPRASCLASIPTLPGDPALGSLLHGEAAAAEAEAGFDRRIFIAHELREEIEEAVVDARNGTVHLPAMIADVFGRTRSESWRNDSIVGTSLSARVIGREP